MNKFLALAFLGFVAFGCSSTGTKTEENKGDKKTETTSTENKEAAKPAVGDTVAGRWSTDSFYEGKVETIDSVKAKIKWSDNSNPSDVDLVDVYAIPKPGAKPDVKVGEIVLAKTSSGTYWNGAEITSIEGDVYVVKLTQGGSTSNVTPEKVIKVSAVTEANFKKQAESSDFSGKAQSKSPVIPAGYKPKTGDKVVAEWVSKSWYSGRVQTVSGEKATVAWDDNSKPSEVAIDKIIPQPNAGNQPVPTAEEFVLVKPTSGARWEYMKVTAVNAGVIEVKSANGQTRSVRAGEYIALK